MHLNINKRCNLIYLTIILYLWNNWLTDSSPQNVMLHAFIQWNNPNNFLLKSKFYWSLEAISVSDLGRSKPNHLNVWHVIWLSMLLFYVSTCSHCTILFDYKLCWFGSPDMMGHPDMVKELMKEDLPPLIPPEGLEQLQNKYVQSVKVTWSMIHGWND